MEQEQTGEGGESAADVHTLIQATVLETEALPQGGRDADAGAQVVERNPITPAGEVAKGIIPGWEIFKGLFLGYA